MYNTDDPFLCQWQDNEVARLVHYHGFARLTGDDLGRAGDCDKRLSATFTACARCCLVLSQFLDPRADLIHAFAPNHINNLHLLTEGADFSGRYIAENRTLCG